MRRFLSLTMLLALGSSTAEAGNSFSFAVAGHRIHVEAPRDCRSLSCVAISVAEMRAVHGEEDTGDATVAAAPASAKSPVAASQQAPPPTIVPSAARPVSPPAAAPPQPGSAALLPGTAPAKIPPAGISPVTASPAPDSPAPPAVATAPKPAGPRMSESRISGPGASGTKASRPGAPEPAPPEQKPPRASSDDDDAAEAPVGDWRTEGSKGSVRIERCGPALCGYVLNQASGANGEMVLINMKPTADAIWSGNIYSRDSGSTYYATIAPQGPDSLRVEACALGRFFCSGNVWGRIGPPQKLVTSHRTSWSPRS